MVSTNLREFISTVGIMKTIPWAYSEGREVLYSASFEAMLLRCVLIDSIANAISHGNGNTQVEFWVQRSTLKLCVRIQNDARPGVPPLSQEFVAALTKGQAENPTRDNHSTGIGLGSSTYSLRALGGDLELSQDGGRVSCLLTLPVKLDLSSDRPSPNDSTSPDSSSITDQLTVSGVPAVPLTNAVADQGLQIVTLDDSLIITRMYALTLHKYFDVPKRNVRAIGLDVEHARSAVKTLLSPPRADIIILDQLIDYTTTHGECYFSTDVAKQLRAEGYSGYICLCTASAPDFECLPTSINIVIDKQGVPLTASKIKCAYAEWISAQPATCAPNETEAVNNTITSIFYSAVLVQFAPHAGSWRAF